MAKHVNRDGLYKKNESPVVESVRQTEGLYKKVKVAKVEVNTENEAALKQVKELENNSSTAKRVLAE